MSIRSLVPSMTRLGSRTLATASAEKEKIITVYLQNKNMRVIIDVEPVAAIVETDKSKTVHLQKKDMRGIDPVVLAEEYVKKPAFKEETDTYDQILRSFNKKLK
jgi:hypothetical protein